MENIAWPLAQNQFNTLSASMTMLALDAYAAQNAGELDKLAIDEVHADGSQVDCCASRATCCRPAAGSGGTAKLRFSTAAACRPGTWPARAVTTATRRQSDQGRHRDRARLHRHQGQGAGQISVGEEIDVHVKIRATGSMVSATSPSSTCCRAASSR
jgi:hypothetical protein